jgi:hypothetical protein
MKDVGYIITIALLVAALVVEKILNHKIVAELHDRLAAKSLADLKYHQEIEPVEIDHNKKVLEINRQELEAKVAAEKKMTETERELAAEGRKF